MASRGSFLLAIWFLPFVLFSAPICLARDSKVSLALYYETLCPFCSNFIVNYLAKIWDNGLISIVDLDLIPYGNARVGSNGTITCQGSGFHGKRKKESIGRMIAT